jgi:hypothetical protein
MEMIINWVLIVFIGYFALKQRVVKEFVRKYWPWIIILFLGYYVGKVISTR